MNTNTVTKPHSCPEKNYAYASRTSCSLLEVHSFCDVAAGTLRETDGRWRHTVSTDRARQVAPLSANISNPCAVECENEQSLQVHKDHEQNLKCD